MINKTKQNWTVGQSVKVGFMTLTVKAVAGCEYLLANDDGTKLYAFLPHMGCRAVSIDEAREMMAEAKETADRMGEIAIERIKASITAAREIDGLFA